MKAVSLFSNCGAGDVGFRQAGFRFEVMAELDPRRLEVCLLNHPGASGIVGDLRNTWRRVVQEYRLRAGDEPPALLAACPPCQGMSSARSQMGLHTDADAGSRDERNLLVVVIAKVTLALMPQVLVVENVPAFLSRKVRHPRTKKSVSAAQLLIATLEDRYHVFPVVVNLCDFGVPQNRKRTFLTFVRRDLLGLQALLRSGISPYPIPHSATDRGGNPETLAQALERFALQPLDSGAVETTRSDHYLHFVSPWPSTKHQMVAAIPPGSGESAWNNNRCAACGEVDVDKLDAVCPQCNGPLLRPVVAENGSYRLVKGFPSSYRRMPSNQPASTITTASGHLGSDYTIHPTQNRLLSPLECALLQTFPEDFKWGRALRVWGHENVRHMIGEAVPPLFTFQHGQILKVLLSGKRLASALPLDDKRCSSAWERLLFEATREAKAEGKSEVGTVQRAPRKRSEDKETLLRQAVRRGRALNFVSHKLSIPQAYHHSIGRNRSRPSI